MYPIFFLNLIVLDENPYSCIKCYTNQTKAPLSKVKGHDDRTFKIQIKFFHEKLYVLLNKYTFLNLYIRHTALENACIGRKLQ